MLRIRSGGRGMKILLAVDGSECSDDVVEKVARHQAQKIVERAKTRLRESDARFFPISSTVVVDSPKDAIVEEAERWGADLIVVGSRGYRGPERTLLGSVSQAVATQAKCSVEIARRRRVDEDEEC